MSRSTKTNLSVNENHRHAVRIGYARVSTVEQDLRLQLRALEQAGCARTFEDRGTSGTTRSRPGLGAALSALLPGDSLVVWRLDRLGRSLSHLVSVVEDLDRRGIGVTSLTENIDSKSSGGRLVLHMMAALAEFERALIAERTRAGLSAAKAAGQRLGRPPRLTSTQRIRAATALDAGADVATLAHEYGVHQRTLERLLSRHRAALRLPDTKESPSMGRGP